MKYVFLVYTTRFATEVIQVLCSGFYVNLKPILSLLSSEKLHFFEGLELIIMMILCTKFKSETEQFPAIKF